MSNPSQLNIRMRAEELQEIREAAAAQDETLTAWVMGAARMRLAVGDAMAGWLTDIGRFGRVHVGVPPQPIEGAVRDRLQSELGEHGRDAVLFLDSAYTLLQAGPAVPRIGQAIAVCVRGAADAILAAGGDGRGGEWKNLSRAVVTAHESFDAQWDADPSSTELQRHELSSCVRALKSYHDTGSEASLRMGAVMRRVTGHDPANGRGSATAAFVAMRDRANRAVHARGEVDCTPLWDECVRSLQRLFTPPEIRIAELDRLACQETPGPEEAAQVVAQAETPEHWRVFLNAVSSFRWIESLTPGGHLDPPDGRAMWPVREAISRFAADVPDVVASWLLKMCRAHRASPGRVEHLVRAAAQAGGPSLEVVRMAVADHPTDHDIVRAACDTDYLGGAANDVLHAVADILLNEGIWPPGHSSDRLLEQLVEGANASNAVERCDLLIHKLAKLDQDDPFLTGLEWLRRKPVYRPDRGMRDKRSEALVRSLLDMVGRCWEWLPTETLLTETDRLDPRLKCRLRAWVLANAPHVDPALLVHEIADAIKAIPARRQTIDDLALVDRAVAKADIPAAQAAWAAAFAGAPSVEEVGRAMNDDSLPPEWLDQVEWLVVLPDGTAPDWARAAAILSTRYGLSRESQQEPNVSVGNGPSTPYSTEELSAMSVEDAATKIAEWRPGRNDWPSSTRDLARVLKDTVQTAPRTWLADPVTTITRLHHPMYIDYYLQAAEVLAPENDLPVGALLDAVVFARTRPWPAMPLSAAASVSTTYGGDGPIEHNTETERAWDNVDRAGVELVKALVVADTDFGDRLPDVWDVLAAAAGDCSQACNSAGPDRDDPYARAINRTCTRALDVVVLLAGRLHQATGVMPTEAVKMFDVGLRLDGPHGAEHRAILGTRLGFLRHAAPEWAEASRDLMFGDAAPQALAQSIVDTSLKWGRADPWVLEHMAPMVRDAVKRRVDRAMDHLLIGMLNGLAGWSVPENIAFLQSAQSASRDDSEPLLSQAGRCLAQILDDKDAAPEHLDVAEEFWRAALTTQDAASLRGFWRFTFVDGMDEAVWEELTLATLRLSSGRLVAAMDATAVSVVAQRAAASPLTAARTEILDLLVRHQDRMCSHEAGTIAAEALSGSAQPEAATQQQRLQHALVERGFARDI